MLSSLWRSRSFSRSRLDFSSPRRLLVVLVVETGVDAIADIVDSFREVDPEAAERSVPLLSSSTSV